MSLNCQVLLVRLSMADGRPFQNDKENSNLKTCHERAIYFFILCPKCLVLIHVLYLKVLNPFIEIGALCTNTGLLPYPEDISKGKSKA